MTRWCWRFVRHLPLTSVVADASADAAQFHLPSSLCLLIWTPLLRRFQVTSSLRPSVESGNTRFLGRRSDPGNCVIGLLSLHRNHLPSLLFSLPSLFSLLLLLRTSGFPCSIHFYFERLCCWFCANPYSSAFTCCALAPSEPTFQVVVFPAAFVFLFCVCLASWGVWPVYRAPWVAFAFVVLCGFPVLVRYVKKAGKISKKPTWKKSNSSWIGENTNTMPEMPLSMPYFL